MSPEPPDADDFLNAIRTVITERVEQGGEDIDAVVEELNAGLFAMGMENGIDGWPKIEVDHEAQRISITVEGWSRQAEFDAGTLPEIIGHTPSGRAITEADIEEWVAQAERGYCTAPKADGEPCLKPLPCEVHGG